MRERWNPPPTHQCLHSGERTVGVKVILTTEELHQSLMHSQWGALQQQAFVCHWKQIDLFVCCAHVCPLSLRPSLSSICLTWWNMLIMQAWRKIKTSTPVVTHNNWNKRNTTITHLIECSPDIRNSDASKLNQHLISNTRIVFVVLYIPGRYEQLN